MKIRPEGAELFHADGWTERYDEDHTLFSLADFANAANTFVVSFIRNIEMLLRALKMCILYEWQLQ